jgi:hypothetical protein
MHRGRVHGYLDVARMSLFGIEKDVAMVQQGRDAFG